MEKIEKAKIYIMKCIINHEEINATAVAEEFGIDRHTVVKHYKELTNQTSKVPRKKRDCYLLNIIKDYEDRILNPKIKLKATYMFIINAHSVKQIGTYSNFVQYVRRHYGKERKIRRMELVHYRFENPPGELLQFDWVEDLKLVLSTGETVTFNLWSGTLAYSRYHFFKITLDKTMQAFMQCLIDNLIAIEGRPIKVMTDNMSAIVNIIGKEKHIHPEVVQFFNDLNIKLILCKPKHPYTKGKVEVSNKYQSWIDPYNKKFASFDEALQLVPLIIMQCNHQPNSETNLAPIKLFTKKEKNALKDLPSLDLLKAYYGKFHKNKVSNASLVKYLGASYGVPNTYCGDDVYIVDKGETIEIFNKYMKHIVTHKYEKRGIHYLKSMYDVHKEHLSKDMSKEEYEKMIDENLRLLAGLGEIEK